MRYDKFKFTQEWFKNSLGRKTKYGNYYRVKYNDADFLMHYTPGRMRNPSMLAVRMNRGPVVYNEDAQWGLKELRCPLDDCWTANLHSLDRGRDITEWRVVESSTSQVGDGSWVSIALFDVDGVRLLCDLFPGSVPITMKDYLEYQDIASIRNREEFYKRTKTVARLDGHPATIKEARLRFMPEEASVDDTIVVNGVFLVPQHGMEDPVIPTQVWRDAQYKPSISGWGFPQSLIDTKKNKLATTDYKYGEVKDLHGVEVADKYIRFQSVYKKWKKAHLLITRQWRATQLLKRRNLRVEDNDSQWIDEDETIYLKGVCIGVDERTDLDVVKMEAGMWYKVMEPSGARKL